LFQPVNNTRIDMTVAIKDLLTCSNALLKPEAFKDYCPNGLQVQGRDSVQRIVSGVTASQALIDRAIELEADVLLVHHGFFWNGENPVICGMKYRRIKALIDNGINLLAYHLPLDAHPSLGNNVRLASLLDIEITGGMEPENPLSVGNVGRLVQPMSAQDFCLQVETVLGRKPLLINGGDHPIETIAWCTGSAQNYIAQAAALGVDAYLSGEISEPTVHEAREHGLHYIAAGHHATERYGVQALGEYLAAELQLDHQFVDIDNPV
jgi:dinuclear metal center YbgI/SA1388 family protein